MTGVLLIAYYFPPMRTSGAARAQGFVRHLPGFGYAPRVLTASTYGADAAPGVDRAWEILGGYRFLFNRSQRHLPPSQRSQARTNARRINRLAAWCKRHLLIPDAQMGWLPHALWLGMTSIYRHRLRLICSTAPPFSSHLLGLGLQALTGLPWVADFRDTWTYDPLDEGLDTSPVRLAIERRLESAVLERADRIVAVTDVACDDFRSRFSRAAHKIRLIPNGFDAESGPPDDGFADASGGPFRLVYTGSFSYSHFRRSPRPLFCALNAWLSENANLPDLLRVFLAGPLSSHETKLAAPLVQCGLVQLLGSLPQEEAIRWQRRAHALLLVDHPRPVQASNIPAKCYEYLKAGKPICALVPEGATHALIRRLGAGLCARPDDPAAIRKVLQRFLDAHRQGRLSTWRVCADALRPFDRQTLTAQLARCFDEVLQGRS